MSPLEGLVVLDLSSGMAGAVTTMLLADRGATVVKVEPPGGDPLRSAAGHPVWNRGKKSVVVDVETPDGAATVRRLARGADVVVETFPPGVAARLAIDEPSLRAGNDGLVHCSITGYGRDGPLADRPAEDALVQARMGLQNEQPGLRPGPVFLHTPLPSYGAALLASAGIRAALLERRRMGRGQRVDTSLAQGALVWTTMLWNRASAPTPALTELWRVKDLPPTPCFEAGDGRWFHPMPQGIAVALAHLGRDPAEIDMMGGIVGDHADRKRFFDAVRDVYLQRPRDEWVTLLQEAGVPCQPVGRAEDALEHPQAVHNQAVTAVDGIRQFGRAYLVDGDEAFAPAAPPALGRDTEGVLASPPTTSFTPATTPATGGAEVGGPGPLAGVRVLDLGTALAGPFGPMILGDLGAEVVKIDPAGRGGGEPGDSTWAACQRGKKSILIDLKSADGRRLVAELIASADVIHYNLRTGVAERLGFGYEQARAINPRIVFCHVTGYGSSGPLASWPGVDQMGQALAGHEHEQGATPNGGHPTWYRFGMCDATAGLLSVLGVLEGLLARDTGSHRVEANILTAGLFLASDAVVGPPGTPTRPHLDARQMGIGPFERLFETAEGWLCVVARRDVQRAALLDALGVGEGAAAMEAALRTRPARAWFADLDARGIPCEVVELHGAERLFDGPCAAGWVASYEHPVWGTLAQPGLFVDFSRTPCRVAGPPPLLGQHTGEVLAALGYGDDDVEELRATGAVA